MRESIFYWANSNVAHIGKHAVSELEAEFVVRNAKEPFPWKRADDRWLVWGLTEQGRLLQVIFVPFVEDRLFVIHARPLNRNERNQWDGQKNS